MKPFGIRICLFLGKNNLPITSILNGEDSDHFMFAVQCFINQCNELHNSHVHVNGSVNQRTYNQPKTCSSKVCYNQLDAIKVMKIYVIQACVCSVLYIHHLE